MRCQFCGWENPNDKQTCEKCNQPLNAQTSFRPTINENQVEDSHNRYTQRKENALGEQFQPKATVRENIKNIQSEPSHKNKCPHCGYEFNGQSDYCPNCGESIEAIDSKISEGTKFKKTIRPNHAARFHSNAESKFRLTALSNDDKPLFNKEFEGNHVQLNRDNTSPENLTITSGEQAFVEFKDNKWTIIDHSKIKSTFVQANHPIELRNGDLILLGDQIFKFEIDE